MSSRTSLQVCRLGESEIAAVKHCQQLIGHDCLSQIGMHLGHSPTDEGRNDRQRVFIRPDDAGKGPVGTKGRSSDWLHGHTGPSDFIDREPNKTCMVRRMLRLALLGRGRRTVAARRRCHHQHAEENAARHTQTASQMHVTLASFHHSVRKKCYASHLYPSALEWTTQGSLIP